MKLINKVLSYIYSTKLMASLFILFGFCMGIATFIENEFHTNTARSLIYTTWWFELIIILFVFNFIGNIQRYQLWKKEKLCTLMVHLAFIFIIIGAGITRYISYEALMPIYEGETSSSVFSEKSYLHVKVHNNQKERSFKKELLLSENPKNSNGFIGKITQFLFWLKGGNNVEINSTLVQTPFKISLLKYVPNAKAIFKKSPYGTPFLHLVESSNNIRNDHYLKPGSSLNLQRTTIAFNLNKNGIISIFEKEGTLFLKTHLPLHYTVMSSHEEGIVPPNTPQKLLLKTLYSVGNFQFVVPEALIKGQKIFQKAASNTYTEDMLLLKVSSGSETKEVPVFGKTFFSGTPKSIIVNNLTFQLKYGAEQIKLPFSIKLNDFQLERYPGSNSPKSYASELTLIDKDTTFDFRIFLNNVLDHKGFRFFQSSYDISSTTERTYLSVNKDRLGTFTTYSGYLLLFASLIGLLISPKTQFGKLRKRLKKLKVTNLLWIPFIIGTSSSSIWGQNMPVKNSVPLTTQLNLEHATSFSQLVIQDSDGRMKPIHTFGSELLRKISKKDHFQKLTTSQVVLSIFTQPSLWYNIPIIYIKKENTKIRDLLGIPHTQKYAQLNDFFNEQGNYKLLKEVEKAHKKKIKTKYEQSILNVDGRASLLFLALRGDLFTLFPSQKSGNNTWHSLNNLMASKEPLEIVEKVQAYQKAVNDANYQKASNLLASLKEYQIINGANIMPSKKKISLEILYNTYDVFKNLFWQYLLTSFFLLIFLVLQLFKTTSKIIQFLIRTGKGILFLLFLYHSLGLIVRWYISEHAPWSNGYESMIYVAWATLLFGFLLGRKSTLTLTATAFVTANILMIAHWNWMDPSIGNLVPVLNSYWLMIHVAIIVASYGPFAIGMILGTLTVLLYLIKTPKNDSKISKQITELSIINELSLTLGLVLLTIGNFLGGMWANESWGRYWGWDPKETWALISIMVYAFVLHMKFVPTLRGTLPFSIASIFAFASILMTYLGVNHLLSGLHSYAAGHAAPIPTEIICWLLFSITISLFAILINKKKTRVKKNENI
ncbi:cytochrome c biogenesis protein [Tenacibaculum maritimum]|uniref:cytochrome c biogenesis protein n=1 Tax=Tenacibaculum maritimum TaxID=107401 RepID=UPI0013307BF5|nr:cytochrome c biogenesis protein CcsA [Tenacibaculum maritimum]